MRVIDSKRLFHSKPMPILKVESDVITKYDIELPTEKL
jgi:hypothetical protein